MINTWGFYSLDNSIKHTMLLRSHSALEKVMTRFDNETAIITELGDLRDLPTSDYYESGDIYNFAGEAADVQDIFPWAKIRARELTLNQFGPHVSGWINDYEADESAVTPIIMNRVYESPLSNAEKVTLLEGFMEHLNSTGNVQGELTNLIIWVHEDGFTISHGLLSSFGYDLFLAEVENFENANEFMA